MKKNDIIELTIEGVSFPNRGYGFLDGQKIVVKNAIPKEVISARIIKKRSSGIEARKESLVTESPLSRESGFCSHHTLCGGCNYQTLEKDAELSLKEFQIKELFEKNQIPVRSWEGIVAAPSETGYRNKCEFSFGDEEKDGDLALGMRKRMSMYEVVSLKDCNIIDGDFLKIVKGSLAFFQKENVPFYHKMRHDGSLRHLVVRKGEATGEILVHLVTSSEVPFSPEQYKDALLELQLENEIVGILHSINDGVADVVKSDEMTTLYGRSWFFDKLFGDLEFQITPYSFFQTNTSGAEILYGIVREFAGDVSEKTVFDLYCGTGTIGQVMAKAGSKEVIGIELVEEAIVAAKENAKKNGLGNCRFIAGDVQTEVEKLEEVPDLIIVDPPRDGMHKKAVERIVEFGANEIVYVSCKPTSLVRDLEVFLEAGYHVERVKLVNLFPKTVHTESVVRLVK